MFARGTSIFLSTSILYANGYTTHPIQIFIMDWRFNILHRMIHLIIKVWKKKKKKKRRISSSNHPFSFSVKFFCSSHPVLLHAHLIRFIHKFKKFISLLFWGEGGGRKNFCCYYLLHMAVCVLRIFCYNIINPDDNTLLDYHWEMWTGNNSVA